MPTDFPTIAGLYAAENSRLKQLLLRRGLSAQSATDAFQDPFITLSAPFRTLASAFSEVTFEPIDWLEFSAGLRFDYYLAEVSRIPRSSLTARTHRSARMSVQ